LKISLYFGKFTIRIRAKPGLNEEAALSKLNAISVATWQQRHYMLLALASPQDVIEI